MHCSNPGCDNKLTEVDIESGYFHCSEECFHSDSLPDENPYNSLFDDPYAEDEEDEEE